MSGPMTCTHLRIELLSKLDWTYIQMTQANNDRDRTLTKDAEGVVTERTFTMRYRAIQRTCRVKHAFTTQC